MHGLKEARPGLIFLVFFRLHCPFQTSSSSHAPVSRLSVSFPPARAEEEARDIDPLLGIRLTTRLDYHLPALLPCIHAQISSRSGLSQQIPPSSYSSSQNTWVDFYPRGLQQFSTDWARPSSGFSPPAHGIWSGIGAHRNFTFCRWCVWSRPRLVAHKSCKNIIFVYLKY